MQDERGDDVHDQAARADDQHRNAVDVRLLDGEAVVRLEEDPRHDQPEGDDVQHRREHLDTVEAEGALRRRLALGDPHRAEREADGARVRRHVTGVREEREAAREDAADDLGEHVAGDQHQADQQVLAARLAQVVCVAVSSVVVPGMVIVVMPGMVVVVMARMVVVIVPGVLVVVMPGVLVVVVTRMVVVVVPSVVVVVMLGVGIVVVPGVVVVVVTSSLRHELIPADGRRSRRAPDPQVRARDGSVYTVVPDQRQPERHPRGACAPVCV